MVRRFDQSPLNKANSFSHAAVRENKDIVKAERECRGGGKTNKYL